MQDRQMWDKFPGTSDKAACNLKTEKDSPGIFASA